MDSLDFEFLVWLKNTVFFPQDLSDDLQRLGMPQAEAWMVSRSEAAKRADIVGLYQDHFQGENKDLFVLFMKDQRETYDRICAQTAQALSSQAKRTVKP